MANLVGPGAAALQNQFGAQSWEERVRPGAYTSPSRRRNLFDFEDVSREFTLRGTVWEFPGVNDAYVQRTGYGARRYPLRCFFSGKDHDLMATAFEASLLEHGPGRLEHPMYGALTVVPFEAATRNDALKTAANQSVVEVTFWTTVGAVYPSSRADPQNEIAAAIVGFDLAAAQQFAASTNIQGVREKAAVRGSALAMMKNVNGALASVAKADESIRREFKESQQSLEFGIDVLVAQPVELAKQLTNLVTLPARAAAAVTDSLKAYESLLQDIFESKAGRTAEALTSGTVIASRTRRIANDFQIADLSALACLSGAITAVTEGTFSTKPEALIAAERISAMFDSIVEWREEAYAALADAPRLGPLQLDTGESYQAAEAAVALTVSFLVIVSFQVVPEKRIVLDRNRTIIDLAAELYGTVDSKLDLLISSNNLTGDEILELKAGRVIRYYPEAA